jgi:subtilisin family serine protease
MLAVTVSRDGLTALVEHPAVAWVESDDKVSIQTEQGIDLIGGGLLHDLGVTGEGAAVAIIDSGVDYMHPALGGGEIPNGKVVYGKDTGDNDDDPMDCEGHGTGVAGIAAGLPYEWPDGGESFAGGVAPGASILAYKAMRLLDCSDGSFYASNVIAAIDDAVLQRDAYNVVAINLSLGGGVFSQGPCDTRSPAYFYAIRDAVEAGVAVFAAAGNEARKTHLGAPACISDAISVGSVYDNNTVPFGLDYGVCQDQQLVPKVPTCYSNSSPYLDLLAPAEPLESVAWDGRVTSFGGTSGATPYATGAAALLAEIANGEGVGPLAPSALRSALKVSGEPVTDPANGGVTSLIELVAAAGVVADSVASMPETVEIPNDGAPVVATTVVDQPGLVRSLRVAVDLVHRKPSELVVTLTAPDGAQLVLHDHGAGSTEDEATAISGHDGLSVVYPDDRQPAEPLDQLNGVVAAGPWTLEIIDDDPTQQYSGVSPRFLGWALDLETETGPETTANDAFVVPVAAHASGANDTFWVTDVRLLNPQFGNPVPVRVFFVPQEEDGSRVFDSVSVEVPGNTVVSLPDILASKLNLDSAQGNLLFQPQGPGRLLATSRTYNTGGDAGTFGQFIGPESAGAAIGAGDPPLWLAQLASTSGFHTNIGLTELAGQEAQVAVRLFDGDTGSQLAEPLTVDVPPFSNVQRNFVFAENDVGGSANAFATVEVVGGAGRVVAYGSVVDDATGDAIAIRGQHAPQASNQMVPIVAKVPGANSTSWVSDVRVLNTTSVVVPLQVVLTTAGGDEASIERSVAAGTSLALDDVVGDAFGRDSGSGSLRVIGRDGETGLIVTSRTYNLAASGTFGQFIPAVIEGFSADDGPVLMHLDASEAFRTNIGVCEVAGGTATVRYVLKNAAGSTLGIGDLEVGPYEVVQVNDVFAEVGAAAEGNARVDLFVEGGDGAITAYGSVVDNISGDAIFVPAANLQTD